MTDPARTPDGSPFRSLVYIDKPAAIHAQMVGAIDLLKEWKWWGPVIAGGALWSWAAGNPANDVDIFARNTWWSRRRAKVRYGLSSLDEKTVNPKVDAGYGTFRAGRGFHVYSTKLANHPSTEVDFVLAERVRARLGSSLQAGLFDYGHTQVAFGLDWYSIDGADDYCQGTLRKLFAEARNEDYVRGKLQTSLWKDPDARTKLIGVMFELAKIQGKLLKRHDFLSLAP